MSRTFRRTLAAVTAATVVSATLVGAQAASTAVAAGTIDDLHATPVATAKVKLTWDPYPGPVDHYLAVVNPGRRSATVDAGSTTATFSDLTWSTGYTATVRAYDAANVVLAESSIDLPGTRLSAQISKASATRGQLITISGTLKWTKSGAPIAGAKINVGAAYAPFPPYKYDEFRKAATTSSNGAWKLRLRASRTAVYRVYFTRQDTAGGWDGSMDLAVRAPMSLKFSANPVRFGRSVIFKGAFDAPGSLVAGSAVSLQERIGGRWKSVKQTTANAQGASSLSYTPKSRTDHQWRVSSKAGPSLATSRSSAKLLIVN